MSMDSYDYIMTGKSHENSQRIEQLEQLCRDMYETMHYLDPRHVYDYYTKRMTDLGLLGVE